MGIHCEIVLYKPLDGVFKPGSNVTGSVKYAVDEETQFKTITVSLKGKGLLHVRKSTGNNKSDINYYRVEEYVNTDNVIMSDNKGLIVPIGLYESQFSFELPHNVPSSFKFLKRIPMYRVSCNIIYYIRIKFERPGFMKFTKWYKKEIEVVANNVIIPRLPTGPCVLGERKTLTQLFTKDQTINLKATIENSVITPLQGGKININYELSNDSNITVRNIKVMLFELYMFYINNDFIVTHVIEVKDTESKTGSIKQYGAQYMDIEIAVPPEVQGSFENAKIVSREYRVGIQVKLPLPHRNMKLLIPVQIGDLSETISSVNDGVEPPPSYWEEMAEYKFDDDEILNK